MRKRGFSLTEMLVVLGIILLLVSLSIPVAISSRKSARMTVCMYRMRELGSAMALYQNQFANALPLAKASEMGWPSPLDISESPVGLPTVRSVLSPYFKTKEDMWRCPMQGDFKPTNVPVLQPFTSPAYRGSGDPDAGGIWVSGYWYMSNFGMASWVEGGGKVKEVAEKLRLKDWLVRNVAGLKPVSTKTIAPVQAGRWLLIVERSSVYHSNGGADMWELDDSRGERGDFRLNALFLDGHVDTLRVKNVDDLLKQMHAPIRQKMAGKDLYDIYPEAYVYPLPERVVKP